VCLSEHAVTSLADRAGARIRNGALRRRATRAVYLAKTPLRRSGPRDALAEALLEGRGSRSSSILRVVTSMWMMSPSRMAAMGPPSAASGETWAHHETAGCALNRPSVIRAHAAAEPFADQGCR